MDIFLRISVRNMVLGGAWEELDLVPLGPGETKIRGLPSGYARLDAAYGLANWSEEAFDLDRGSDVGGVIEELVAEALLNLTTWGSSGITYLGDYSIKGELVRED
jgi:hypothetical protein